MQGNVFTQVKMFVYSNVIGYYTSPVWRGGRRVQVQQKDLSDEAIARAMCAKVGDSPGVSYSDIAAKAYECGRTELAIKVTISLHSLG